jgi:hypothetical protein
VTRYDLLLHGNAAVHNSGKAIAAMRDCGFEKSNQPLYSPLLASSDDSLFWNLKRHLHGHWFSSNNELKIAASEWSEEQDKDFYFSRISSMSTK